MEAKRETLNKLGIHYVPNHCVLPPSERPNTNAKLSNTLPIIDISSLKDPSNRSHTVDEIRKGCIEFGFFQTINHGIPLPMTKDALDTATEFFNLPTEKKMLLASDDVHDPLRENMGNYVKAVQLLQKHLMEAVLERLGLNLNYLHEEIEGGSQLVAVNCYPACPEPDLALGIPPHSDYSSLTILQQSSPGPQIMNHHKNWLSVPVVEGALTVQLGVQIEVTSNGLYKSVVHRVTLTKKKKRLSMASLHSLDLDKKMGPAPELMDEQHPESYKKFSFREFLDFILSNDISKGRFIDTLKINP